MASVVLGVVEGVTEFLPISSTGHLIVANRLLGGADPAFEIAIQIGAISAIAVLYRRRLFASALDLFGRRSVGETRGHNLWLLLLAAAIPAALLGLLLDDWIEAVLFSPTTVATTLVLGGVLLLWLEAWLARTSARRAGLDGSLERLTFTRALGIGMFQCLALVPGTSRSGATIAGGLLLGLDRVRAAEFSFLVGLPILYGACGLKLVSDFDRFAGPLFWDFLIGCAVSFVTAYLVVGPFVRFLQAHTFRVFGWYRIVAGLALFALIAAGVL